jgi:hypothetical protein
MAKARTTKFVDESAMSPPALRANLAQLVRFWHQAVLMARRNVSY